MRPAPARPPPPRSRRPGARRGPHEPAGPAPVSVVLAILWKDLVTEWRSRDRVVAMAVFSFLVVLVLHFALPARGADEARRLAPGLLWLAYVFAALLGLN